MRIRALAVIIVAVALGAAGVYGFSREEVFPHEKHAGLFPLCIGCHEGVPAGDRARSYPPRTLCASCHNDVEHKRVEWAGPTEHASNLQFSHPEHDAKQPLECSSCHANEGAQRMTVERTIPQRCFACHAHAAQDHFSDARCAQCHVPLARTRFAAQRVAALPKPPSHARPDFMQRAHGELARTERATCEMCHTRERCASCHVDAAQRAEVKAMLPAGPDVQVPPTSAKYFLPETHRSPKWLEQHGASAKSRITDCAACHTRESCATCHAAQAPTVIASLPARAATTAPGVTTVRRIPASHAAPYFDQKHGTIAATQRQSCNSCHKRTECEACHSSLRAVRANVAPEGTASRIRSAYHAANFMERHASSAYSRKLECSNCHDTARFCRDCHERRGMRTVGRLQAGFHDAQPLFLLNHGKPARQALESCASCHKQTDCMQCHSGLGAFRVSPHGPGFDPKRVQERNARMCFACHLSDPLGRTK